MSSRDPARLFQRLMALPTPDAEGKPNVSEDGTATRWAMEVQDHEYETTPVVRREVAQDGAPSRSDAQGLARATHPRPRPPLADAITHEQQQHGVTQAELARRSGIPARTLRTILRGDVSPKMWQVEAIANALGLESWELDQLRPLFAGRPLASADAQGRGAGSGSLTLAVRQAIRDERAAQGISIRELARRSGIPERTVRRILDTQAIHLDQADAIAKALGMRCSELIRRGEALRDSDRP